MFVLKVYFTSRIKKLDSLIGNGFSYLFIIRSLEVVLKILQVYIRERSDYIFIFFLDFHWVIITYKQYEYLCYKNINDTVHKII